MSTAGNEHLRHWKRRTRPARRGHPRMSRRRAMVQLPARRRCSRSAIEPAPHTADPSTHEPITPDPGAVELSRRLLWTSDSTPGTGRRRRAHRIPLGIRLGYALVGLLGLFLAGRALIEDHRPWGSANQVLFGLLLAVAATVAAAGLCRFGLLRLGCTGIGLWLAVSPCVLPRPITCLDMLLGLAAFLIAGAAGEAIVDQDWDRWQSGPATNVTQETT